MTLVENTLQSAYDQLLFLSGQNTSSLPIADATRMFNYALNDYTSIALTADNRWKISDLSNGVTSQTITVDGSTSYSLASGLIAVDQVEYTAADGTITVLTPTSRKDNKGTALGSIFTGSDPTHYHLQDSGKLTPLPTPTAGTIKVYGSYIFSHFATSVGTEVFPTPPHHIAYFVFHALRQISVRLEKGLINLMERELTKWEGINGEKGGKIRTYYITRDEDSPLTLTGRANVVE